MTMTRDQIEAAARAIGGGGHGWRLKAAEKLNVSERTMRNAINEGKWSSDFEAKLVSVMASDHVRVGAVREPAGGLEADLVEIAGGKSAGWQQRAADASGLSVTTIKGAIEGRASKTTRSKIRQALISAATAGGVKPLGRQVGDWVVAMPEGRMPEKTGVIAEAVVIHTTQPVVIVHVTHRAGTGGTPPKSEVRTRWIDAEGDLESAKHLMDIAISKGQDFLSHQLKAIASFKSRKEAAERARMIGSIGDDADLLESSSYRELLISGTIEKDGDTHANFELKMNEEISRISAEIRNVKEQIRTSNDLTGILDVLEDLSEKKGRAVMLREYARSVIETGEYASPAAAVIADHLFRQAVLDGRASRAQALLEGHLDEGVDTGTIDGQAVQRLIDTRSWAIEQALKAVAEEVGGMVVGRTMIWLDEAHAEQSARFQEAVTLFGMFYVVRAPVDWEEMTQAQLRVIIKDYWDRTADAEWEVKMK